MTYFKNDPRTLALADGTAATTANDPAPDGFTPTKANAGQINFRNVSGLKYWECVAAAATDTARMDCALSSTQVAAEFLIDLGTTLPTANQRIVYPFNSGMSGGGMGISWDTTGHFVISDAAGATLYTSSGTYTGKVRIFLGVKNGTTTTNGEIHAKFYVTNPDTSTTPDFVYDSSTANAGTVAYTQLRFGKILSSGIVTFKILYWHYIDTQFTNAGLGPLSSAPPTVSYTKQNLVEVDSNATSADTVTLTQTAGPTTGVSISGPDSSGVFRVLVPDTISADITLSLVATNTAGSDTKVITIPASGSGGGARGRKVRVGGVYV